MKQTRMKYVVTIPEIVLLVVTLALFTSIYPITVPWKPVFASPDTQAFYPSDYNLFGSTKYVLGSLTDLQSDKAEKEVNDDGKLQSVIQTAVKGRQNA